MTGKLIRDTSTPERREWWKSVLKAAERAPKLSDVSGESHKTKETPRPRNSEQT